MVGQFGEIIHTLDGGKTWKFQRSGTQANLNKVYFADANHGLIVGDEGGHFDDYQWGYDVGIAEKRHVQRSL